MQEAVLGVLPNPGSQSHLVDDAGNDNTRPPRARDLRGPCNKNKVTCNSPRAQERERQQVGSQHEERKADRKGNSI